jgi:hypothetical protein
VRAGFWLGVILIALALEVLRWAWVASHRGGFPLLSWRTWEDIRIYVIAGGALIAARVAWLCVRTACAKMSRPPGHE